MISIGTLVGRLILNDELSPALLRSSQQFTKFSRDFKELGHALLPFSIAVGVAGAAVFKFGKDFEAAMTRVGTLSNVAEREITSMSSQVLAMSGRTAKGPKELADALLVVTSTGMRGAEALQILERSAQLSTIGLGETKDIARAVTAAMTAYGKENLSAAAATNKLLIAVQEGGAEATEFAGALGGVIGIAKTMGVSFDQVLTSIATFTRLGVSADTAATGLRATLLSLQTPADEQTKALKQLGLSVEDVRKKIADDGLAAALQLMVDRAKGNIDVLGKVIPESRALASVLGTVGTQAQASQEILKRLGGTTDEVGKQFERASQDIDVKWNQAIADVQRIAIHVFEGLKGQFTGVVEAIKPLLGEIDALVGKFNEFSREHPDVAKALFGLGAAAVIAGPALIMLGTAIRIVAIAQGGLAIALKGLQLSAGAALIDVRAVGPAISASGIAAKTSTALLGGFTLGLAAIVVPFALIQIARLIEQINGLMEDMDKWKLDDASEAAVHLRAMAEASKIAHRPVTELADALDILRKHAKELQTENMTKGLVGMTATLPFARDLVGTTLVLKDFAKGTEEAARHVPTLSEALRAAQKEVAGFTAAQRENIQAGLALGHSAKEIAEEMPKAMAVSEDAVKLYSDQLDKAKKSTKDFSDLIGTTARDEALALARGLATGQIDLSKLTDESQRQIADALVKGSAVWAAAGLAVPASVEKQLTAVTKLRTIPDLIRANAQEMRDAMVDVGKGFAARVEIDSVRIGAAMMKNIDALLDATNISAAARVKVEGQTLQTILSDIKIEFDAKRAALVSTASFHKEAMGAIANAERATVDAAVRLWKFGETRTRAELTATAQRFKEQYDAMLESGLFTLAQLREAWKRYRQAAEEATDGVKAKLKDMFDEDSLGGKIGKAASDIAAIFDNISGKAAETIAIIARTVEAVVNRLAEGDWVGAIVAAVVGIGKVLGDALHKTAGEDVVERVGRDWGITITEAMGDEIAKDAKRLFGGSRLTAEVFNIDKLIGAAGGLSGENITRLTRKMRDVFSLLESGSLTSAQAVTVLNKNFAAFADFFQGGLISTGLREIVTLTRAAGVESKALGDFLKEQASRVQSGLAGILAPLRAALDAISEAEKKTGDTTGAAAALAAAVSAGTAAFKQEDLDRFSRLTIAAFGAAIAAGKPFLETLLSMKDEIGTITDAASRFGLTQLAAFGDLSALQSFFATNEALARSIDGTNQMLIGLANSGLLSQETFADLGAVAVANFNKMVAGGLSVDNALKASQATLQTLWELVQEGTFVVDDQTQALLDQAKEAGLVGEAHMTAAERATRAMESAADAMTRVGDILERMFGNAETQSGHFITSVLDDLARLPKNIEINVQGHWSPPNIPQLDVPASVPTIPQFEMAAGGAGVVTEPTLFLAGEAGRESFAFSGANQTFQSDAVNEIAGLRQDINFLIQTVHDSIEDAVRIGRAR